jgi:hypothetical protein
MVTADKIRGEWTTVQAEDGLRFLINPEIITAEAQSTQSTQSN